MTDSDDLFGGKDTRKSSGAAQSNSTQKAGSKSPSPTRGKTASEADYDASAIEVVANGGSKPTGAMLAWAQELQLGSWFTLDHNNQITQVQFAWRSERKHLNLFASTSGKSFLIQGGRLAAYLQAGLLFGGDHASKCGKGS